MSETSISLLLPATIGGGGGSGTVTGASNGLSLSGTDVMLGGSLISNTTIDGNGFTHDIMFGKMNRFLTLSHIVNCEFDSEFRVFNYSSGTALILSNASYNSIAFMNAIQDSTPMKWQGGSSDGRQLMLEEINFSPAGGFDFVYTWKDQDGTVVIPDFMPSNVSNAYIIELPDASTCEGREIKIYYNNLQQADLTVFEGPYTNGIIVQDYLSRGIDFSLGRDNFWILKSMQHASGLFKWIVISNMRAF